ncbi:MAG TPA: MaoC family dehydratase [Solirubrobacteraceae bacterium]|jgi:acyl dehydratase
MIGLTERIEPVTQDRHILRLDGADELLSRVGSRLGVSAWHEVAQRDIDVFADATGDHQWIHVDPHLAAAGSFGTTIAHGLYTLSRGPSLNNEIVEIVGFSAALNYGFEKVRFPAPLPVSSRFRMAADLLSAAAVPGGIQIVIRQTFERDGELKPVCVADAVSRWLF